MTIQSVMQKINKKYGEGTLILGSQLPKAPTGRIPSGSLALDLALGGGWPVNQWHEVIGNESSGKTVVVLKTIAANQARDPKFVTFWAAAESLPLDWVEKLGVDLNRFYVLDSNVMEDVFDAVLEVTESRDFDCVVIDSLPALVPSMEDEQTMAEFAVGAHARLTGKFTRKGHKATKRSLVEEERPVVGFIINQWREKIGVMHGDPRTTPGGKAKNFFFYTRVELRRTEWLTDDDKHKVGQRVKALVFKNKSAPGQRDGEFDFYFDEGGPVPAGQYDSLPEIVNVAIANGTIVRRGRFYYFNDEQIASGREQLLELLQTDDGMKQKVSTAVLGSTEEPVTVKSRGSKKA